MHRFVSLGLYCNLVCVYQARNITPDGDIRQHVSVCDTQKKLDGQSTYKILFSSANSMKKIWKIFVTGIQLYTHAK